MSLYNLTEAYNNLMNLDINDDELAIHLKNIEEAIENKADNIAKLLRNIDSDILGIKAEEESLCKKRKALENRSKSIKSYLQSQMELLDKKKLKTTLFSFNIQKNAPSLKILDESKIPEDYWIIEKKINKNDLKAAVKEGLFTDAAELVSTESLRIR